MFKSSLVLKTVCEEKYNLSKRFVFECEHSHIGNIYEDNMSFILERCRTIDSWTKGFQIHFWIKNANDVQLYYLVMNLDKYAHYNLNVIKIDYTANNKENTLVFPATDGFYPHMRSLLPEVMPRKLSDLGGECLTYV